MWEICVSGETGGFCEPGETGESGEFFCESGVSGESSCFGVTRRSRSDSVLT